MRPVANIVLYLLFIYKVLSTLLETMSNLVLWEIISYKQWNVDVDFVKNCVFL